MESPVVNLYNQFQSLRAQVDGLNEGIEPQFLQMAVNFEECRKKWLRSDEELVSCKEGLAKAQTERGALEVKLKHARNQVDVEIRRRQKAEAVYEKLERQLQLIRELLTENNGNSVHLSEEQRSALAFLSAHSQAAQTAKGNLNSSRRLTTIDESASLLSDISYDQTDDSLDWDSSVMRTVRLRKRQKRRSSRKLSEIPSQTVKKPRSTGRTSDRLNESIVTKTTITVPVNGGAVEAVSTIETVPYWTRSRKSVAPAWADTTTTDQSETASEAPSTPVSDFPAQLRTPRANGGGKKHHFIAKTVIKSEFCVPCGRRTKFGKMYLRCQDCRVVTHPECRERCPLPCNPTAISTPIKNTAEATLADFAPVTSPKIPVLVIYCIKEIEHRGLHEVGLYRVSGHERMVKELKEKLIRGKTLPPLNKIDDINVITGVLKDFFRKLPEPLLTFHLNKAFMEAAEIQDDGNSLAMLYQTISELPQPNRDTLACLMIHLQKVSQSVDTKMDVNNLARVFGPTLVGHAVPDPEPMTILHDTNRQPRVIERLLSIPASYWGNFAYPDNAGMDNAHHTDTPDHKVSILGPVTTPEHQMMAKTPSSSSLSQRMMHTFSSTTIFGSKSKGSAASNRQGNFFASPQLK
ncbi:rac GTPase-activating protein 1-like [Morone saxatilis]|uniref:rac GTPase-activating protein 1-like n=1 Tax=Morone saxatilis TaxID=34816 RepID=UPI0015E1CC7B|nr:rac GTPase-activating protein 1-like [Morone saxatilis]